MIAAIVNRCRAGVGPLQAFRSQVPAMYVAIQAVLSLYASGRTTGIVMDGRLRATP